MLFNDKAISAEENRDVHAAGIHPHPPMGIGAPGRRKPGTSPEDAFSVVVDLTDSHGDARLHSKQAVSNYR